MNKIVEEIMKESLHLYKIKLNLISGIAIEIDCCKNFFAYDPETAKLEIHEERKYLDKPLITIKEEDIEAWSDMKVIVNKRWFQTLKNYVACGMFSIARAYLMSYFILFNADKDDIEMIPYSIDDRDWELYLKYLQEKLTR